MATTKKDAEKSGEALTLELTDRLEAIAKFMDKHSIVHFEIDGVKLTMNKPVKYDSWTLESLKQSLPQASDEDILNNPLAGLSLNEGSI